MNEGAERFYRKFGFELMPPAEEQATRTLQCRGLLLHTGRMVEPRPDLRHPAPVENGQAAAIRPLTRRDVQIAITGLSAFVAYFALMATIGGLSAFSSDWNAPLVVRPKGLEFTFQQAWSYLVPAIAITAAATISMFGNLIALVVRYPGRSK